MFGTRKVLEQIRDVRVDTGRILDHMDELRAEIRDLNAQNRDEIRITREMMRRSELAFVEFQKEMRASRAELAETRAETRAQTRGLYALIDRLEGGGAAPAT